MVGEEKNLERQSAVVAGLYLQVVILLGFAAILYLDYIATTDLIMFVASRTVAVYFGVLSLVAIWLAGQYNAGDIRSRRLQLWAVICIIHTLFPIITSFISFIAFNDIDLLFSMAAPILLFISSVIILVYSKKH